MHEERRICEEEVVYSGSAIAHLLLAILLLTGVDKGPSVRSSAAGTVTHTHFDSQKAVQETGPEA